MNQIKVSAFSEELKSLKEVFYKTADNYSKLEEDHRSKVMYAQWHIEGLIYHFEKINENYSIIVASLKTRLETVGEADIFVMNTPEIKHLMYEFYAFVNLSKITLDNIRHFLYPLFTNEIRQLPKSISDFKSCTTNCPIFERIGRTEEIQYLIDLRNCLVHYRSFATSHISLIQKEGVEIDDDTKEIFDKLAKSMAKGIYRITESNDIVFNILIPDKIYDRSDGKRLANFTFDNKINILGESMRFLRHIVFNYLDSFTTVQKNYGKKIYTYKKSKFENPVKYLKIQL